MTGKFSHSKELWLKEGLTILANKGPTYLTIDHLIEETKKTKGSFYHHFINRDHYSEELIKYWALKNTDTIIRFSEKGVSTVSKLKRLLIMSLKLSERTDLAFRAWALYDPVIKKHNDKIDRARLNYLYRLYKSIYKNKKKALTRAYKVYFTFIGYQQLKFYCNRKISNVLASKLFDE